MPATIVRGFASTAKPACTAEEGGMVTYIKGYLKEQLSYAEALVLGVCYAMGDMPLPSETVVLSSGASLGDCPHYAEALIVTNS